MVVVVVVVVDMVDVVVVVDVVDVGEVASVVDEAGSPVAAVVHAAVNRKEATNRIRPGRAGTGRIVPVAQEKAGMPVSAWPRMSVWISLVPS